MRSLRYLASSMTLAVAMVCAAADDIRQLSFNWPHPTLSTACDLQEPEHSGHKAPQRFAGTVQRNEVGVACTVQLARKQFDALYRLCTVAHIDSVPRERFACWVQYSPRHVTFLYSYVEDLWGAPACEFACSLK